MMKIINYLLALQPWFQIGIRYWYSENSDQSWSPDLWWICHDSCHGIYRCLFRCKCGTLHKIAHTKYLLIFSPFQDNGEVKKLRVENSWGEDRGEKGYLVMSAEWFKEFGFEVVVDKKYVPADILSVFDQDPIVLPAWDPMGTLAQ